MADNTTILIAEDDANIAALVARYLKREGFSPLIAQDGRAAVDLARQARPALVVLDLMLPQLDGWEVCRTLRRESDVPVLMLTARAEEVDRVVGLSMGADDYVVKPFSPRELVERIKAILRRARPAPAAPDTTLRHGGLTLVPERHRVTLHGQPVDLTRSEFALLHALMGSPGRVFTRDELIDRLHGPAGVVVDRAVDVHVGRLRKKIEVDPTRPEFILTVRGTGYKFTEGDEVP